MQSKNLDSAVLSHLLRIALGNPTDKTVPSAINWPEVMDLAAKQGVLGVHLMVSRNCLKSKCPK